MSKVFKCSACDGKGMVPLGEGIRGLATCKACYGLGTREIEEVRVEKINYDFISADGVLTLDDEWEDLVHKYTKEIIVAKEQALTQYVMKKQQDEIDRLREEIKLLRGESVTPMDKEEK